MPQNVLVSVLGEGEYLQKLIRAILEKEVEAGNISVRDRSNETVQMSVDEFVAKVLEEIKTRA